MPRSRINGNFIDKTFSIVANILLRIIPTTSGEKRAFTYYRDALPTPRREEPYEVKTSCTGKELPIPTGENRPFYRVIQKLQKLGLIKLLSIGNKL
uniref:Uncharacterized protein n=1 Tax=Oryza rufipogon TaxID=4529 RepID=A0A0E0R1N2_ORYRU